MAESNMSSMQQQAYHYIKQKIATCQYAPNQMISESQLREELGFSRTPVREAVGRLVQEGLLTVFPKRGIVVSGISLGDVYKIFEVRILLEPYILRSCHDRIDLGRMRYYQSIFHSFDPEQTEVEESLFGLDDGFHELMMQALDNQYLLELYARIQTQNIRLRIMSGSNIRYRIRDTMAEHAQIADACLKGEWEEAAKAMEHHLHRSRDSALAILLGSHGMVELT